MARKYHITKTEDIRQCNSQSDNCIYDMSMHFDTRKAARIALDQLKNNILILPKEEIKTLGKEFMKEILSMPNVTPSKKNKSIQQIIEYESGRSYELIVTDNGYKITKKESERKGFPHAKIYYKNGKGVFQFHSKKQELTPNNARKYLQDIQTMYLEFQELINDLDKLIIAHSAAFNLYPYNLPVLPYLLSDDEKVGIYNLNNPSLASGSASNYKNINSDHYKGYQTAFSVKQKGRYSENFEEKIYTYEYTMNAEDFIKHISTLEQNIKACRYFKKKILEKERVQKFFV